MFYSNFDFDDDIVYVNVTEKGTYIFYDIDCPIIHANVKNIRITLDSNVRANEGNFNLFSENLLTYPVMHRDDVILEVKYNNFLLSYIKDMLRCIDRNEMSASKYCMARKFGLGG